MFLNCMKKKTRAVKVKTARKKAYMSSIRALDKGFTHERRFEQRVTEVVAICPSNNNHWGSHPPLVLRVHTWLRRGIRLYTNPRVAHSRVLLSLSDH